MTRETDAATHARWLLSNDPVQFERLVKHYEGPIFGFLARMGFAVGDAEDVAQDVFMRLWTARDRYDPDKANVSTWLWSIARNVSLNRLKQQQRWGRYTQDSFDDADTVASDPSADPGMTAQTRQQLRQVDAAIAQLSAADRLVIALVYVEELSNFDAAQLCDCSVGTFRVRVSRARQRLLDSLNHDYQGIHDNEKAN